MEKQNRVGFVTEVEVESKSLEEEGLGSIQKEKSQKQNNEGLLSEEGTESIAANLIEEEGHEGIQKGKPNNHLNNNLGGGVLIEGLNKKGTNGIEEEGGGQSIIQQGEMIKSPNSLYLLKRAPSFPGGKEIIPLLYMPPSQNDTSLDPNYHKLLDLSKRQVGHSRIYLPELGPGCRICGFSKRWMAVMEDINIHLLNPFTRDRIRLPDGCKLPVIPQNKRFNINYNGPYYILKVAVLDSDNMVIGALDASGMIFFTGKNDDHWTIWEMGFFEDIITWKEDRFLGLKGNGDIILFNIGTATCMLFSHVELPNWPPVYTSKSYLAECTDGGLLVIARLILKKYDRNQRTMFYTTQYFQVFKLQGRGWVRKYDLWNSLIFLGVSESRVYEVHHGNTHGYNRIYFSDDNFNRYNYYEEDKFISIDTGHFTITRREMNPSDYCRYSPLSSLSDYCPPSFLSKYCPLWPISPLSPPLWVGGPAL